MIEPCERLKPTDKTVQRCFSLLERALQKYHPGEFAVRLWDGTVWESKRGLHIGDGQTRA